MTQIVRIFSRRLTPALLAVGAVLAATPALAEMQDRDVARTVSLGGSCNGCELSGRNLTGASFSGASFVNATFVGSDLRGVEMMGSNFTGADFTRANLHGVEILAANLANVDTPGFQARDIDFAGEMSRLVAGEGSLRVDSPLKYRVPYQASLDGNTVELSVEQAEFSRNSMDFQTSLTFLTMKFSGLKQAIEGR